MHLIEIPEKNIKRYMPEDLSECDKKQYIDMSGLIYKYQSGKISLKTFNTHALYYLLYIIPAKKKSNTDVEKWANIHQLTQLVDTFFEKENKQKIIKLYYIHNPIEKISNGFRRFYGPTEAFTNIGFGEYVDALNHYADFHATNNEKYLYLLMATLYRRAKPLLFIRKHLPTFSGDNRQKYNPEQVENIAKKLRQYPIGVIYGFYLLFASFQKYLTTASLWIEGKEIKLELLFTPPTKNKHKTSIPGLGMRSILYTMAESGVFGDLKKVRNTSLYEVLLRMYDIRKSDLDTKDQEK